MHSKIYNMHLVWLVHLTFDCFSVKMYQLQSNCWLWSFLMFNTYSISSLGHSCWSLDKHYSELWYCLCFFSIYFHRFYWLNVNDWYHHSSYHLMISIKTYSTVNTCTVSVDFSLGSITWCYPNDNSQDHLKNDFSFIWYHNNIQPY